MGSDRLIVPKNLAHIYVSPRKRAQRTVELLGICGNQEEFPWGGRGEGGGETSARVEVTEEVREWDYGDYEGITSAEIRTRRRERGEGEWDIWRDGCPGGE